METLEEEVLSQSEWLINTFKTEGYKLDGTIDSLVEIDRFFIDNYNNGKPIKSGKYHGKRYSLLGYNIACYIGEVIRNNVQGTRWNSDNKEILIDMVNLSVKLPNKEEIKLLNLVFDRVKKGSEASIYPNVYNLTKEYTNETFNNRFNILPAQIVDLSANKPWWKFW